MTATRIPLLVPYLPGNARAYLEQCVDTNFVSSVGPMVPAFEVAFSESVGSGYAVACASGTAALHLALLAVGVAAGDEVFVSDLTFIASANPVVYCGASVTVVDSEPTTWNLHPQLVVDEVERRLRSNQTLPKAIVVVHLLGHPAWTETLVKLGREHGMAIVEDAAEALGASWSEGELAGRQVGTVGTMGCFSFNGNKVITTGGGGMVVTESAALAQHARYLATQAQLPGTTYEHGEVGYNYRLSNLGAALGLAQLEQLDSFVERKRAIAARYDEPFSSCDGVEPAPNAGWARRSGWLYSALFADRSTRDRVRAALHDEGIESRPIWVPIHRQLPYRGCPRLGSGAVADDISARALSLPSSVTLTTEEQDEVAAVLVDTVKNA